ncbi:MAG: glycoside hydrolase family 99-like domain-containing protein [Verrucomicrobia bacterium]|nr:glycoside hydrolase family 99-like domain-containing protein [Verrucomicrobiota bacterium]
MKTRLLGPLLVLLLMACCVRAEGERPRPIVGAIRWDGWYGEGAVVRAVEHSLGQPKYHFRLPWFARVMDDGTVRINGDSQEVIEREVAYAAQSGLNYWAFVDYWNEAPALSIALNRYLSAKDKRSVRYCLVEEGARLDKFGRAGWPRLVEHFRNGDYQTVLSGRPLLFVFVKPTRLTKADWDELKRQTVAAGLQPPYLVLMGWNPEQDAKAVVELGFDAVSAYARGGSYSMTQPSYAQQCAMTRRDRWEQWRALRLQCITFASAGWDTRPRNERPPSWMKEVTATPDPTPPSQQRPLLDAVTATPEELAAHVKEAITWTQANRDLNPANALLIYAWNEHDEGGWLQPTLGANGQPDEARIKALATVLRPPSVKALPSSP